MNKEIQVLPKNPLRISTFSLLLILIHIFVIEDCDAYLWAKAVTRGRV